MKLQKILLTLALVVLCNVVAFAQKVTLVNESGIDFYGIMMSPSDDDEWEDVMGEDMLENGTKVTLTLTNKNKEWDIRFFTDPDDLEHGYIDFSGVDLTGVTQLRLFIDEDGDLAYSIK